MGRNRLDPGGVAMGQPTSSFGAWEKGVGAIA